jgi:F-type H+-transporting ATPase subunit delta
MATKTHNSPTAVTYARSLLELAQQRKIAQPIAAELNQIKGVLDDNPTFVAFLRDPGISSEERTRVVDRVLKPQVDPLLASFLGVLNAHGRLRLLDQVIAAYNDLLDETLGKIEVDVTVPQELSADELEGVRKKVGDALKKEVVIHQHVDESIIGGLVLRVEDKLIDASVRSQLQTMKRRLLAARPK